MVVSDLVEFLQARLEEDELMAHEAASQVSFALLPEVLVGEEPSAYGHHWRTAPHLFTTRAEADLDRWGCQEITTLGAAHVARHDPVRVLAEVEMKRRIIEELRPIIWSMDCIISAEGLAPSLPGHEDHHSYGCDDHWAPEGFAYEWTLRVLALPYAGHPDYDERWRP